jgi:uncharacterized membrane protein YeaQ/YmgE (transglycosylase-associated protein family)
MLTGLAVAVLLGFLAGVAIGLARPGAQGRSPRPRMLAGCIGALGVTGLFAVLDIDQWLLLLAGQLVGAVAAAGTYDPLALAWRARRDDTWP